MFLQNSAAGSGDCGVGVNTAAPVCSLSCKLKQDDEDLRLQTSPELLCLIQVSSAQCAPLEPVGSFFFHPASASGILRWNLGVLVPVIFPPKQSFSKTEFVQCSDEKVTC